MKTTIKKRSILLIEDDELDIVSFQRTLSKFNVEYELHTAYNGKEAMAMLTEQNAIKPDLILLDLSMPKMNGFEFLKVLRSNAELCDLSVFVMTTSSEPSDRHKAEQYGIKGYFIKPLSYTDNTRKTDSMEAFVQFHLRHILAHG